MDSRILSLLVLLALAATVRSRKNYGMYVWTHGFDSTVAGCDVKVFEKFDEKDRKCFTHTWSTYAKRKWLWATCNRAGREISTIFISGVLSKLRPSFDKGDCKSPDVTLVKKMVTEGHTKVPGLGIYALFASSDEPVSERFYIKYVIWYNDNCAASPNETFDGIAVNNEKYHKCGTDAQAQTYLDRLKEIVTEAGKQKHGKLLTHYSIGWHWSSTCDNKAMRKVTWGGKDAMVTHHMIDIFDHVDVQVGYTMYPVISDRLNDAGAGYSRKVGKKMYATFYTEKSNIPCQTTFFPQPCKWGKKTEKELMTVIDDFKNHGIADVIPTIHFFRGVYSSGGNPDWPAYR